MIICWNAFLIFKNICQPVNGTGKITTWTLFRYKGDFHIKKITCAETYAIHESYVFPRDLNNSQIQFGGRTLEILDANAGIAGVKFAPSNLSFVTAGYDHVQFLSPLKQNEIVKCTSYVTGANRRAIEVFTKFEKQDKLTREITPAFIAFCSLIVTNPLNEIDFPELVAETTEEKYLVATYSERLKKRQAELQVNKSILAHLEKH
jgi:acyl-CoA hydrolase